MTTLIETLAVKLIGDTSDFDQKMGGAQEQTAGFVAKMGGVLGGLTVAAGAAVAGAVVAVGKAALDVQMEFDQALDNIINGTGASGAALDAMGQSVRNLAKSAAGLNTDMGTIGSTMAEVNTRTGATGQQLEDLTGNILQFSRLTGNDSVKATQLLTRTMGDWGVSLDDSAGLLDQLYGAGQTFGISFDSLAGKLVQFGAPLRQMGFGLEESIAMFGKWEKEGVNAELVVGSLRIAAGNFARDNIPLRDGLMGTMEAIKGAASESEALALAMEVFGARAGPDMAAAIREGRFELDGAIAALQGTKGGLDAAAESVLDFPDHWQIAMAQVNDALIPLGASLARLAERLLPLVVGAIEIAIAALTPLIDWIVTGTDALIEFATGNEQVQQAVNQAGQAVQDILGPSMERGAQVFEAVGGVVRKFVDQNLNFMSGWIDRNMPRIQQIVENTLSAVAAFWEQHGAAIVASVQRYFGWIADFWSMIFRTLLNVAEVFLQVLTGDFDGAGQTLQNIVQDWKSTLTRIFSDMIAAIVSLWQSIDWGGIGRAIIEGIGNGIRNMGGWLAEQAMAAAQAALDAAKALLGIFSPSRVAAEEIGEPFAQGIGAGIRSAMSDVNTTVTAMVNGMVGVGGDAAMAAPVGAGASIVLTQNFYGQTSPSDVRTAAQGGVLAALQAAGL